MDFYFNNGQQTWDLDSPSSSSFQIATRSDEELLLASSCPKKRAGRKKFKETRHPVYRGVRKRNNNKWVCELRAPSTDKGNQYGSRIWLGTYPTADMAARAHDVAALALRGRLACLNFADSASLFLVPQSGDIKEIQKAAAHAAEAFRPPEDVSSRQDPVRTPDEDDEEEEEEDAFTSSEEKEKVVQAETAEEEMVQESFNASCGNDGINFDMHKTILQMSQGTLLSPPHHHHGGDASWERSDWTDIDTSDQFQNDVSLWSWSYSM